MVVIRYGDSQLSLTGWGWFCLLLLALVVTARVQIRRRWP